MIDRLIQPLLITALTLCALVAVVQTIRLSSERQAHAETREAWAAVDQAATRAALDASTSYRQLEARMSNTVKEVSDAYHKELERIARTAAGLRADNDRLRDAIKANVAGGRDASDIAADSDLGRAVEAWGLLANSLQVQAELAGMGERDAAIARGLRSEREALTCSPVK